MLRQCGMTLATSNLKTVSGNNGFVLRLQPFCKFVSKQTNKHYTQTPGCDWEPRIPWAIPLQSFDRLAPFRLGFHLSLLQLRLRLELLQPPAVSSPAKPQSRNHRFWPVTKIKIKIKKIVVAGISGSSRLTQAKSRTWLWLRRRPIALSAVE